MRRFEAELEKVEKGGVRDGFPARSDRVNRRRFVRHSSRSEPFTPRPGLVETTFVNREVELDAVADDAESYWLEVNAPGDAHFHVVPNVFADGSGGGGLLVFVESSESCQAKFRVLVIRANVRFRGKLTKIGLFGNRTTGFFHVLIGEPAYAPRAWD